jgi:hypothetical protein
VSSLLSSGSILTLPSSSKWMNLNSDRSLRSFSAFSRLMPTASATSPIVCHSPSATISGVKFHDVDADGMRDVGEEGLEGWTIQLWKLDGIGELVDETTTGSEGDYIFTVTEAGHYKVTEVLESGWMQTAPAGGCYEFDVALGDTLQVRLWQH